MPIFNSVYKSYKPIFEYSYDFRNKTQATVEADGWVCTNNTPAFDSNWVWPITWNKDVYLHNDLWSNLNDAKKVTYTVKYVWGDNQGWWFYSVNNSNNTNSNWFYSQWILRSIFFNASDIWSTNSASDATWTFIETVVLDLVNKTYDLSWHLVYNWTLNDTQISSIKSTTTFFFWVFKSTSARCSEIYIKIEY